MEKGWRVSETSSSTCSHDAKSYRFPDSFQGMFYSHDCLGSEENKQIRPPAANVNIDSQRRTREGKSWALVYEDKNYGGQQEDTELSSPFLVYTGNKDYSFPARRNDFEGEMAAFESTVAAQAVSNRVSTETLDKHYEKRDNLTNGPAEKKRKEDALEDNHTGNRPKERESYWERRKKNNASAKKSREARKARELEAQMKAAFLERENLRMLAQLMIAQEENDCLKRVLCAKM